jgi:hypothetical protein
LIYDPRNIASIVVMVLFITGLTRTLDLPLPSAYSDSITGGAFSQRIGSFDVELKTVPSIPLADDKTNIFVRIGSIDGNDAIDTPISIRIAKQGHELYKSNTIFVPNGHYTYPYSFAESGIYGIYILVHDPAAVSETRASSTSSLTSSPLSLQAQDILFTFPVNVQSKSFLAFSEIQLALILTVVSAICVIIIYYLRVKRNRRARSYQSTRVT